MRTDRSRAWAYFARLLPPELRTEVRLLEWIRDGEIERVVAVLEAWGESERTERDRYRDNLGRMRMFFTLNGNLTDAGWKHYLAIATSDYEKERIDDIQDELRGFAARIAYMRRLVHYALDTAEGTSQIEVADNLYAELSRLDSPNDNRREP